ncbi:MAG: diguanylate cyclase [Polyangiaceae bacterium]|nr:diguanylate cyclase [Polyangiaceae bacterium]
MPLPVLPGLKERSLFAHLVPGLLCKLTLGGKFLEVSEELATVLGAPTDTWIGRGLDEAVAADEREIVLSEVQSLSLGAPISFDTTCTQGEKRRVLRWWLALEPQERVILAAALDVTEAASLKHKMHLQHEVQQAEVSAQRDLNQLNARVFNAPVGIYQTDRHGRFVFVNRRWQDLTGMTDEEALGIGWARSVHADERHKVLGTWQSITDRGEDFSQEFRVVRPDGSLRWVVAEASPMRQDGQITGYLGVVADVTERVHAQLEAEQNKLFVERITESTPYAVYLYDLDRRSYLYSNRGMAKILGYPPEETAPDVAALFQSIIHPEDLPRFRDHLERLREARDGTIVPFEGRVQHYEGNWLWLLSRDTVFKRGSDGSVVQILGTIEDTTQRKEAQEEISEANHKLKSWAEELERKNKETDILREMSELLQTCRDDEEAFQVIGCIMRKLFPTQPGALSILSLSRKRLEQVVTWGGAEAAPIALRPVYSPEDCWAVRRGNAHRVDDPSLDLVCAHVDAGHLGPYTCAPMIARGTLLGVLHVAHPEQTVHAGRPLILAVADGIELALANVKLRMTLRDQAIREPLTGLYNRRYMEEGLDQAIYRAKRHSQPLTVVMIDVDHFKRFNDTFGHDAGDLLLKELGRVLKLRVRREDIACRFGGEEFALILPECSVPNALERLRKLTAEVKAMKLHHDGRALGTVTLSVGVAVFPEHGQTPELLLRRADEALYQAKLQGRDQIRVAYTDPNVSPTSEPPSARNPSLVA